MKPPLFRAGTGALLLVAALFFLGSGENIAAVLLPIAAHEAGHLLALWLLGLPIRCFRIEFRGFCIEYGGFCTPLGHAVSALSGPAAGLAYAFAASYFGRSRGSETLILSSGVSLLLSLFNLLPVLPLDGGRLTGSFEALGNRHLLERPLAQVQCSRRFFAYRREAKRGGGMKIVRTPDGEPIIESESPEYRERLESALAAAEHGAVVLSPCISDGERQIAREAMKRRLPLVALKNMGFAKLEKPAGRYFDACAEGRLLLLAPAAWPYTTQEKPMTRFDATALNRIAQWLAGGAAVEINYHGMKPANIDELAEKAVLARKGGAR